MALTFPSSPTNGQVYTDTVTGNRYVYDSSKGLWKFSANSVGVTVGTAPPPANTVAPGAMWYNTNTGRTFIYYDDGDSKQWVENIPASNIDTNTIAGYVNPVFASMNAAYATVNAAYSTANAAYATQNADYTTTNAAYSTANAAFGVANTALQNTTGTFAGSLTATGTVSGLSSMMFRNKLINGSFDIFQRASSATSVASNGVGYVGPDRFFVYQNNVSPGVQVSQVSSGLTGFANALKWGRPSGNTKVDVTVLGQALETVNSLHAQGQYVTLSFWAKAGANFSSSGSGLYASVYSGTGTDQSAANMTTASWTGSATPIASTVTLTTSWQRFTLTSASPLGSTVKQLGVYFNWSPTGTAGADDYVYITGMQLEVGQVATPFEFRQYGTELSLCQRYYWRDNFASAGYVWGTGSAWGAGSGYVYKKLPTTMRSAPVLSYGTLSYLAVNYAGNLYAVTGLTYYQNWTGDGGCLNVSVASGLATNGVVIYMTQTGATYLGFDSEL